MTIDPHPLLDAVAFGLSFPRPVAELATPLEVLALLKADAAAPLSSDDRIREAVRAMLRHGGFKPTGRSKPASEYLRGAAVAGRLGPINLPVDICNAVSLHSGLPLSVVDAGLAREPLRIGLAPAGAKYVFNLSGQEIDIGGLVCLHDADGPCANAVKDAQRTKTIPATTRVVVVVWGTTALPGRAAQAAAWYEELAQACGAAEQPLPSAAGGRQ
ncbi:MAG: hypothetical protein K2W96_15445 [Gemmataceae bacterium]|nr:hypothetical protein [Gemmataceae bacterium]